MTQKDSPAFNAKLLRRFINLMGLFPVGTLVRLETRASSRSSRTNIRPIRSGRR